VEVSARFRFRPREFSSRMATGQRHTSGRSSTAEPQRTTRTSASTTERTIDTRSSVTTSPGTPRAACPWSSSPAPFSSSRRPALSFTCRRDSSGPRSGERASTTSSCIAAETRSSAPGRAPRDLPSGGGGSTRVAPSGLRRGRIPSTSGPAFEPRVKSRYGRLLGERIQRRLSPGRRQARRGLSQIGA
jgi:hypothetical protein